eukprot:1594647-Rhodomonas_salina.1
MSGSVLRDIWYDARMVLLDAVYCAAVWRYRMFCTALLYGAMLPPTRRFVLSYYMVLQVLFLAVVFIFNAL